MSKDDDVQDDTIFRLSDDGMAIMLSVLLRAAEVLSFDISHVNSDNLLNYIRTLSACDEIWEGTDTPGIDDRIVLLAITLGSDLDSAEAITKVFLNARSDQKRN